MAATLKKVHTMTVPDTISQGIHPCHAPHTAGRGIHRTLRRAIDREARFLRRLPYLQKEHRRDPGNQERPSTSVSV